MDADPAGWESVIGETLVDPESLKPTARQFLCTLTTRGAVDILLSDIAASTLPLSWLLHVSWEPPSVRH